MARPMKVADLRVDEALGVRCRRCQRDRILDRADLARLAGWQVGLQEVVNRLRCRGCGERPDDVQFVDHPAAQERSRGRR